MGDEMPMPHRLGPHEILLPIATGSLTSVYLARLPSTDAGPRDGVEYAAVELAGPPAPDRRFSAALLASAKPLCRLRNANVVRMLDATTDEHGAFVVMDYIPGDSLAGLQRLARESGSTLPKGVALRILVDALRGLHAAHELADEGGKPLGLVHGDFSPRNILVGTDGIARVTGFGFAKAFAAVGQPIATRHAPPEGPSEDRRSDVWAAGVSAWETLTGRTLDGATAAPRVSSVASEVPAGIDEIVAQALRVERDLRTGSAQELADALRGAAEAAGLLADTSDVAAHVTRLVGAELTERKALLDDVRRAQRERPLSAPDVRTLIGMAGAFPTKRAPLPTLPDVPPPVDDGNSELRIAIELRGAAPAERANEDILGQPSAVAPEQEPEVFRSPLAPEGAEPDIAPAEREETAIAGLPGATTPLHRLAASVKPWVTPPWTTKKISLFAGIGGGLIGFLLVLVAVSGKTKAEAAPGTETASAHALAAAMTATSLASSSAPEDVAAKNSSGSTPAAPPTRDDAAQLHIKANGPIASVRVDGRLVDAVVPAPTITVDLEETERDHPARIVVTSTDGRVATATTDPAAATTDLEVTFGPKPAAPRPRPQPASTVKHPWSKSKR